MEKKDRTEDPKVKIVNIQAPDLKGNQKATTWATKMVLVPAFGFLGWIWGTLGKKGRNAALICICKED